MTTPSIPQPKKCSKCGEWFPATTEYFHKQGDGLRSECKVCYRAYQAHYAAEHAEKIRAKNARWRSENPEYQAHYSAKHVDERRARDARFRAEHADQRRAYTARYSAENPEVRRASGHRRRARERQLPNDFTAQDWRRCLEYWNNRCAYCGKEADFWAMLAIEHWIAVKDQRPDNPGTVATNIIPACHARKGVPAGTPCCNQSKGNRDPIEWLVERFGKRKAFEIQKRIEAYFAWVKEQEDRLD